MGSQAATGVLGALGLAALAVFVPALWRRAQWFSTFVHEAGHALMATLTGRYVEAVEILRNGGGCTYYYGNGRPGEIAISAAGYAAPPAAGLGIVAALEAGVSTRTILLVVIFVVIALLLVTGNAFGVVIVATVLAVLALLLHRAGPISQTVAALTAAWFLLLAGLRDSLELTGYISRTDGSDDASHLADETGIPAMVWVGAFAVFAGYALYLVSRWLLVDPTT